MQICVYIPMWRSAQISDSGDRWTVEWVPKCSSPFMRCNYDYQPIIFLRLITTTFFNTFNLIFSFISYFEMYYSISISQTNDHHFSLIRDTSFMWTKVKICFRMDRKGLPVSRASTFILILSYLTLHDIYFIICFQCYIYRIGGR